MAFIGEPEKVVSFPKPEVAPNIIPFAPEIPKEVEVLEPELVPVKVGKTW